jgi:hypothetical protein
MNLLKAAEEGLKHRSTGLCAIFDISRLEEDVTLLSPMKETLYILGENMYIWGNSGMGNNSLIT